MIVHTVKFTEGEDNPPCIHTNIFVGCAACDTRYRVMLVSGRQRWEFYTAGTLDFTDTLKNADCAMIIVTENTAEDQQVLRLIDDIFARKLPVVGVECAKQPVVNVPEKLSDKMTKYGWEWFAEFINDVAGRKWKTRHKTPTA